MSIRKAMKEDIPDIEKLLRQVCTVHSIARPDMFIENGQKYFPHDLEKMMEDKNKAIFVFPDDEGNVLGYAMCVIKEIKDDTAMVDMKTLYLDDLCVDEQCRGEGIGKRLFDHVLEYAKDIGCYNLTLNVWEGNDSGKSFYDKCGLKPQKTTLEKIL